MRVGPSKGHICFPLQNTLRVRLQFVKVARMQSEVGTRDFY